MAGIPDYSSATPIRENPSHLAFPSHKHPYSEELIRMLCRRVFGKPDARQAGQTQTRKEGGCHQDWRLPLSSTIWISMCQSIGSNIGEEKKRGPKVLSPGTTRARGGMGAGCWDMGDKSQCRDEQRGNDEAKGVHWSRDEAHQRNVHTCRGGSREACCQGCRSSALVVTF